MAAEEAIAPETATDTTPPASAEKPRIGPVLRRTTLNALQAMVVSGGLLFLAAGRLDIPAFWWYLALQFSIFLALGMPLVFKSPGLMRERWKAGGREVAGFHKVWRYFNRYLGYAVFILAGLDVGRFQWAEMIPLWGQLLGAVATVLGAFIIIWSMRTNYFFSTVVRIQHDRGQKVITTGPYAFVRHPGYIGMMLRLIGVTAVLGSWVALAVSALWIPLFIARTSREDELLQTELEGYQDYSRKVRYRLVPALW